MLTSQLNNILETIYKLKISRVWRGYGKVIFLELGSLVDGKGQNTLWLDVSTWSLTSTSGVFESANETYESIDSAIAKLDGKSITEISFDQNTKVFSATFSDGKNLTCLPEAGHAIHIIRNDKKQYLSFEVDNEVKLTSH